VGGVVCLLLSAAYLPFVVCVCSSPQREGASGCASRCASQPDAGILPAWYCPFLFHDQPHSPTHIQLCARVQRPHLFSAVNVLA
jgi:hypothetical protein